MGELRKHKMTSALSNEMEETVCTYRGVRRRDGKLHISRAAYSKSAFQWPQGMAGWFLLSYKWNKF